MRFRTATAHLGLALAASILLHGAGIEIELHLASCAPHGERAGQGHEREQAGIADSEIEVGLEAPAVPHHAAAPPEPPPPAAPPRAKPAPRPTAPPPLEEPEPEPPEPSPEPPPEPGENEATPEPVPPSSESGGDPLNSVGAQRRRIGGGATCEDPVAGTWKSSIYDGIRHEWYAFTLSVQRTGNTLSGTIRSHFWAGSAAASAAPSSCAQTRLHALVSMPAQGRYEGGRLRFGARSWQLEQLWCGGATFAYQPDRFTGTVDEQSHELQTIVTDGVNLIDQPMVFRRVACE